MQSLSCWLSKTHLSKLSRVANQWQQLIRGKLYKSALKFNEPRPLLVGKVHTLFTKVNCLFVVVVVVTADAIDAISCTSNSKLNPKGTRDASAGSTCWLSGHFASYVQFMKVWRTFCDLRVIQTKLFTLLSAFIFLWEYAQVFRR